MIAIPNMEVPKSCWECFYSQKCKLIPRWLTDEQSHICATRRLDDCPIIEIDDDWFKKMTDAYVLQQIRYGEGRE